MGKIMQGDQTASKLKMRAPSSVNAQVHTASIGTAQAGAGSTVQNKITSAAQNTANTVKRKSPIPAQQATALAKLVEDLGKKGIPLTQGATDITKDGRFSVELAINTAALSVCHKQISRYSGIIRDGITYAAPVALKKYIP